MADVNKKVTLIPERSKVIENRRLNKRQTTLRAFTFIRDWELRVSPIPSIQQGSGSSQVSSSSPIPHISPGPAVVENASQLSQRSQSDECIPSGPSIRHQLMQHSRSKNRQRKLVGHSSIKSMLESTRLSTGIPEEDRNSSAYHDATTSQLSHPNVSTVENAGDNKSSRNIDAPSLLSQPHVSRAESGEESEQASEFSMHSNAIEDGPSDSVPIVKISETRMSERSRARSTARHASQIHQEQNDENVDINANLSNTPNRLKEGSVVATTPSTSALAVQTSPKSGPAFRKKGNLKRRSPDNGRKANDKAEPLPKGKVCLWTASERNRSASDVTELDVILSNIEEVCLDYREELTEKPHRTAVAKFFMNTKKDFTDMIALRQEQKFLQSSVKKSRSDVHKKRKLLLSLQQQNARLTLDIDRLKKEKTHDKDQTLVGISQFLEDLKDLQMKANQLQDDANDSINHKDNIPALLMETCQLSKVNSSLRPSSRKRKK